MGMRSKCAIFWTLLTGLLIVAALATPWWYTKLDGDRYNCFIDGTCRDGDFIFKDNGDSQFFYDATLILMVGALASYLLFAHFVFFLRSVYHSSKHFGLYKILAFLFGLLSLLCIIAAALTFGIGVPDHYSYVRGKSLYGDRDDAVLSDGRIVKQKWGANAGWWIAMVAGLTLLPALFFALLIGKRRDRNGTQKVYEQRTTKTTTVVGNNDRYTTSHPYAV